MRSLQHHFGMCVDGVSNHPVGICLHGAAAARTRLHRRVRVALFSVLAATMLAGCALPPSPTPHAYPALADTPSAQHLLLDRVTWGATASAARSIRAVGTAAFLDDQLQPDAKAPLPTAIQAQIDAMTISRTPMATLAADMQAQQRAIRDIADDADKKAAQTAWQQAMNRLQREAATRSLLRDLYSPKQLQEQMTWFWMNHFNVYAGKRDVRVLVGDLEDTAIRPRALGRFGDLLRATVRHPAMLRYLDNDQNAGRRVNENYARELMELHTLGIGGGYSQRDVQELARVLTGMGIRLEADPPKLAPRLRERYVRDGLFEFNPARHDDGQKQLLGAPLTRHGLAEVDEALERLGRAPATARHVSQRLAQAFLADQPPAAVVDAMAATFTRTDGDIAAVLRTLFQTPQFAASLGSKFKDPVHYAVSGVRLAYDDRPVLNVAPMLSWLNRMGQPLYGHETPDGYPLAGDAWSGSGQLTTRFEIARTLGYGNAGLFRGEAAGVTGAAAQSTPAGPGSTFEMAVGAVPAATPPLRQLAPEPPLILSNAVYQQALHDRLAPATQAALDQARTQQEWNTLLLASPEFMLR